MLPLILIAVLVSLPMAGLANAGSAEEIFAAIRNNDLSKLQTLCRDPQTANARGRQDTTPLMHAASFGSVEAIRILLKAGADVNAKNAHDATALIYGAWDAKRTRLLLEHGADVNAQSKQGRTALIVSSWIDDGRDAAAQLIARGADVKAKDRFGMNAIHGAAFRGDLELAKRLVEAGASAAEGDLGGWTPLHHAAGAMSVPVTRYLLSKGADVNARNVFGGKVRHGDIALTQMTPLMMAAPYGSPELIQTQLEAGANPQARDIRGMSPLMLAVASERQDAPAIRLLIERGADVNARDRTGQSVLDWARKYQKPSILRLLEQSGATSGAPVEDIIRPAEVSDPRKAVERGAALLQKTNREFFRQSGCMGCHHQPVTHMATAAVRKARLSVDEENDAESLKGVSAVTAGFQPGLVQRVELPGSIDSALGAGNTLLAAGAPANLTTDSLMLYIASFQRPDGVFAGNFGISRAPVEERDIMRTAHAARLLKHYAWPARQKEFESRVARAKAWLLEARPQTSYERAEQLLGLHWSGAAPEQMKRVARSLLAEQRADGGWSQNPYLQSDAYATGLALWALSESGMANPPDPAYRKGVKFLLGQQREDGSWAVRSRAPKFQPYFESGFPYGHDQWISTIATAYATMALAPAAGGRRENVSARAR